MLAIAMSKDSFKKEIAMQKRKLEDIDKNKLLLEQMAPGGRVSH